MTTTEAATRYRGRVRLQPNANGPEATLTVRNGSVTVELADGHTFTYPPGTVRARSVGVTTICLEIDRTEVVYFDAREPIDVTGLTVEQMTRRRLPPLPSIETQPPHPDPLFEVPPAVETTRSRGCRHDWRLLRLAGGLTRRACNLCRTVSIEPARRLGAAPV